MDKKRNMIFYTLVAFVSIVLSSWIITVSSYKDKENQVLQSQIDSVVNIVKVYHGGDINMEKYLPAQRVPDDCKIKELIFVHTIVVSTIILFLFLYIRGSLPIKNRADLG